jgi:hypothetical protein
MSENKIGDAIIASAMKVHSVVGPGFLNFHVAHLRDGIVRMVNGL